MMLRCVAVLLLVALASAAEPVLDVKLPKAASAPPAEARIPDAYPDLFEGGATASEKGMMDWLYQFKFVDGEVSKQVDMGSSGRGMVWTRDVKQGEEAFSIPIETMVYTSNPHISPLAQWAVNRFREAFRSPGSVAEDFELTEMGLIVLFEKRNETSFFSHYLKMVQDPLCPAFFTEEQLAKFEYPWIKTWRLYFLSDSIRNFRKFMELPEMEKHRSEYQDYEFLWAVSTVLQRSFDWGPDTRREYVMVPYLDMINHKPNVMNNYYYSHGPFTINKPDGTVERKAMPRGMVLGVDGPHTKGDEVAISYSTSSNNVQLLLQYGFVVTDNEHDYIIVTMQEPKDEQVSAQVEALGPVISVGLDGIVSSDFIRAINVVLNGQPEVTVAAAEKVLAGIEFDLKKFSTTLADDVAALKARGAQMDRAEWSAFAYRVESKKHLRAIISYLNKLISDLKAGLTPKEQKSTGDKIDWPSRFIKIMFDETAGDQTIPPQ